MCRTYFRLWRHFRSCDFTFDLNPKCQRTMPSFDIFSWVIYRVPPNPNIKVVYRDSSRNISGRAKGSGPLRMRYWKWRHRKRPWPEMTSQARECTSGHVQNILPVMTSLPIMWLPVTSFPVRAASGDVTSSNAYAVARSPLLSPKYSLSCPDTLVQKHTQAPKSDKGPGNTFDWNPKWARTLPSLIYCSWNIYRDPPPLKNVQILMLISCDVISGQGRFRWRHFQ
jgi:hypothetical protein